MAGFPQHVTCSLSFSSDSRSPFRLLHHCTLHFLSCNFQSLDSNKKKKKRYKNVAPRLQLVGQGWLFVSAQIVADGRSLTSSTWYLIQCVSIRLRIAQIKCELKKILPLPSISDNNSRCRCSSGNKPAKIHNIHLDAS